MKFKNILIACLFLAILTIGAASAQENVTSETSTINGDVIANPINESLELTDYPDGELKGEDINLNVEHENVMTKNDFFVITSAVSSSDLAVSIDGQKIAVYSLFRLEDLPINLDYGNHSLEVNYTGNDYDPITYNPTHYKGSFIYSYAKVTAYNDGELEIYCEEEMNVKLYLNGDLIYDGDVGGYATVYNENLYSGYVLNYTLITSGKGKYKALTITDALHYDIEPDIDVAESIGQGEDKYLKIELPPDANGSLKVYLNDIEVNATFENGKTSIPLNTLEIGDYRIRISYDSDSKYDDYDEDYRNLRVTYNPNFKISPQGICYAAGATVRFEGSSEMEGKISILVDYDEIYEGSFKNGIAEITFHDSQTGPMTYKYAFKGTNKGEYFEYEGEFNITLVGFTVSLPESIYEKQSFKVTLTGPQGLNGRIDCSENPGEITMKNGKATFTVDGLDAGINTIDYSFYHNGNMGDELYSSFNVNVTSLDFHVSLPETIYEKQSFKVTLTNPQGLNGEIEVSESEDVFVKMKNGKATFTVNGLKAGTKKIDFTFYQDGNYGDGIDSSFKVNIVKPPTINAKNFKKDYTSKSKFKVRILNNESKSIGAGETVKFYLYADGKKIATKTAKTNKDGYAKVDFNVKPYTYKVKVKYSQATVKKKYTVNPIVKVNEIRKYKKIIPGVSQLVTSKKFEFGVTLKKVDGKILKGEKVKMTFYRQDYKGKIKDELWGDRLTKLKSVTLKANSKGVCKIAYKKLPFKVTQSELEGLLIGVKISYKNENHWASLNVGSLSPIQYYFIHDSEMDSIY